MGFHGLFPTVPHRTEFYHIASPELRKPAAICPTVGQSDLFHLVDLKSPGTSLLDECGSDVGRTLYILNKVTPVSVSGHLEST